MNANYRIIVTKVNGDTVKLGAENCHDAKSIAGMLFHHDKVVRSVYVGDIDGNHFLYLVQEHPEKTENIPSETASY